MFYSVPLTLIVLVSLPLYFGLSLAVVPILRRRLDVKFARGAENQAMLVETVSAIQTVKATALEPAFGKRWDNQLAAYVSASFKTQNLASVAHEGVNLIGKLVNAATLWYGAHLVMGNELSVGQFVAFNMFAQRVSQPIMRMAQLWTDFQQTGISVARLGDILNTRTEVPPSSAAQLRRQVGVVLQENILFNRSVRENIAIIDPAAPLEAVMRVAQLAGAHDFISELPEGYDTVVGEQGSSLSGGQRQRVAIARALFSNPRVLIFDEATSALDYESEAIIQRNMQHICQGRTVLIIAHRLSAVRHANRIIVMDKGKIVEAGTHEALVAKAQGIYAQLWGMQSGGRAAKATQVPLQGASL